MKIKIKNYNEKIPDLLSEEVDNNKLLAKILYNRGIDTEKKAKRFLYSDKYNPIFPEEFPNMDKAIKRIIEAIENREKIVIYGDYDVDGVTSTAILLSFFKKLDAKVNYHIPDRFEEGYGMNEKVIEKLADDTDLILSCDCGISDYKEVKFAKSLGLDVIVTDHHDLPEKLPPADYILSPKLLSKGHRARGLPGAGMAYYLIKGIINFIKNDEKNREHFYDDLKSEDYLDLLALAIVADVVPLKGENRFLLQKGLDQLSSSERVGIQKLFELSGVNPQTLTEDDIGFRLGPLLNAAGRMESADIALETLLADEENEAIKMAKKLVKINDRRKKSQRKIIDEAEKLLQKEIDIKQNEIKPIILYQPHWHEGLLGIAAGRLAEDYNLPVILLSLKEEKNIITGSARSISDIHINKMLSQVSEHLIKYGGHAAAAGLSLHRDEYTIFKKKLTTVMIDRLNKLDREKIINVDQKLSFSQVNLFTYYSLRKLSPFGEENPKPVFYSKKCKVLQRRSFGNNKHLRMTIKQNDTKHNFVWWWGGDKSNISNVVDIVYTLDINRFKGKEELQPVVKEVIASDYLYKTDNNKSLLSELEIKDLRNWKEDSTKQEYINDLNNAVYFYEGRENVIYEPIINRYQVAEKSNLVILSLPPHIDVFKDIIYNNEPDNIILGYNQKDFNKDKNFLKVLIGITKYIIKEKSGVLNLKKVAVLTAQLEDTVLIGLKYLQAAGFLEVKYYRKNYYFIKKGERVETRKKNKYKSQLMNLLKEKKAFNRFLFTSNSKTILEYLKNS